jgi:transposase-like protein
MNQEIGQVDKIKWLYREEHQRRKTMSVQRKRYSAELKTSVALEAIKGHKTANEIAAEYGVHPTQIAQWKKQALDGLPDLFSTQAGKREKSEEALIASLYQQIGQLKVQVDWLGKKSKARH